MTTPTPAQLSDALLDVARGYSAELVGLGTPNPQLGEHLAAHAKRIPTRVGSEDPRLNSFTGHTDATGYTWWPDAARTYLEDDTNRLWSFERWFTGLAAACAAAPELSSSELAELAEDAAQYEAMRRTGLHPVEITHAGGTSAVVFKRPTKRTR